MNTPPVWRPPHPLPLPLAGVRVVIDAWRESDAPALHSVVDRHRDFLGEWLPWARHDHEDLEASQDRIRVFRHAHAQADGDDFGLGIFEKGGRTLLGATGLHRVDADRGAAEIGYWIRPDRHGEGLCTEAVGTLVTSAFADWGLRRLVIECDASNPASARVAKKLGFRLEAHHQEARWREGHGWADHLVFALLDREWDPGRRRGPAVYDA